MAHWLFLSHDASHFHTACIINLHMYKSLKRPASLVQTFYSANTFKKNVESVVPQQEIQNDQHVLKQACDKTL